MRAIAVLALACAAFCVGSAAASGDSSPTSLKVTYWEDGSKAAPDEDPDVLFANLIDYVDEDNVPGSAMGASGSTDGPYVESVPMINEVFATNTLEVTDGNRIQVH